jgi:DNA repair protein RadD
MIDLRYYQQEAIDETFNYWIDGGGNPLIDLATGTGKSLVIAEILRRLLDDCPTLNVLMLTHVRELVQQNYDELLSHWPDAPVGINSAGLGRRDRKSQILFATIQSVANYDVGALGERGLVIIDEAHLVPHKQVGQYKTLIGKLREVDKDLRVLGLTATPFRLDSGRLDQGDDRLFHKVVYSYGIGKAIEDEFLAPLVAKGSANTIDVSNVARRGGEFVAGDLEVAASAVTQAACDEMCIKAADRKSWLAFCSGVDHAFETRNSLRDRGITCETITGKTPKADRDRFIEDFKNGKIRCLTNANVLTTGFNVPGVDMIAMLRPTLSTSLYVQMLGRGTRVAPDKDNCLVMDFAGNVMRHGPVDDVSVRDKSKKQKEGRAEVNSVLAKTCPDCSTLNGLRALSCWVCKYEWPVEPKHSAVANENITLLRRDIKPQWVDVKQVSARLNLSKLGNLSVRLDYLVGLTIHHQYLPILQRNKYGQLAQNWWNIAVSAKCKPNGADIISIEDYVATFNDAVASNDSNLKTYRALDATLVKVIIKEIRLRQDGKFTKVFGWKIEQHFIAANNSAIVQLEIDENNRVVDASWEETRHAG